MRSWLTFLMICASAISAAAEPGPMPREQNWTFSRSGDKLPEFWSSTPTASWEIAAEPEHPANAVLAQNDPDKGYRVLLGKDTLTDFDLQVRLRTDSVLEKRYNWQMGLLFRYRSPNRYYRLYLSASNLALIRCSDVSAAVLAEASGRSASAWNGPGARTDEQVLLLLPMGMARDAWHTLGVSCRGETLALTLDGRQIERISDGVIGSGRIGLVTYNTRGFYDDMRLKALPAPDLGLGAAADRRCFSPVRDQEMLFYYVLPKDAEVDVRVLDPAGKMYALLAAGKRSAGTHSLTWTGQGLAGGKTSAGVYTLQVTYGLQLHQVPVKIE